MPEPLIRVTAMPADTNPYGGAFHRFWIMSQMALAACSLAPPHRRRAIDADVMAWWRRLRG